MILSGLEIKNRIGKDIGIDPYNENQINPNSYNLKLHDELLVYKDKIFEILPSVVKFFILFFYNFNFY